MRCGPFSLFCTKDALNKEAASYRVIVSFYCKYILHAFCVSVCLQTLEPVRWVVSQHGRDVVFD